MFAPVCHSDKYKQRKTLKHVRGSITLKPYRHRLFRAIFFTQGKTESVSENVISLP